MAMKNPQHPGDFIRTEITRLTRFFDSSCAIRRSQTRPP
jgi:plasmid maintenance system antidote protein VapI